jgi:hypothetical protein
MKAMSETLQDMLLEEVSNLVLKKGHYSATTLAPTSGYRRLGYAITTPKPSWRHPRGRVTWMKEEKAARVLQEMEATQKLRADLKHLKECQVTANGKPREKSQRWSIDFETGGTSYRVEVPVTCQCGQVKGYYYYGDRLVDVINEALARAVS